MSPRLLLAVLITFCAAVPAGAESFRSWAARGAREQREKNDKAAFSSYSNALSMWEAKDGASRKATVLCARAELLEKTGDDAGAFKDLTDCLALNKKNSKAFHRRGLLRLKAGKSKAAIGDFYRAVALNIRFGQAYADRARAYEKQGERAFAREDYRLACKFGIKPACAKVKSLAPAPKTKSKAKPREPEREMYVEPSENPEEAPPAAAARKPRASTPAPSFYRPKYQHCRAALNACVEKGGSFGACVRAAPNCDVKTVRGCCPAACLEAYQKSTNTDHSEASAFRTHFAPSSACSIPPKEEED